VLRTGVRTLAVHDHRTRENQFGDSHSGHRREQDSRTQVIVPGIQREVVEIDPQTHDRGLVTNRVDSIQRRFGSVPIADVAAPEIRTYIDDRVGLMRRRMNDIEHDDLMSLVEQLRNDCAADESGTAGDEYAHCFIQPQPQAFRAASVR
jgi:hypothetical protein